MAKNIVICSDGTWNSGYKRRGTNVFKLFEAVDTSRDDQVAFYDEGVGTQRLKVLQLLGGAFGLGLGRNVRQLYEVLVRVYKPGDCIYMFGFSRGAYTVRTLAGMINRCGILSGTRTVGNRDTDEDQQTERLTERELRAEVRRTYKRYRATYRKIFTRHVPEQRVKGVTIKMIGAWDTVDAVGLPFKDQAEALNSLFRFKFPDRCLPSNVECAFHALAIDEERRTFAPILWDEASACDEHHQDRNREQVLKQVWFAGAHANVGGGYPRQGMSLVSLSWMMREADDLGLHFSKTARRGIRAAQNVHDQLYDSRSGFAALYRYKPREVSGNGAGNATVRIHESVVGRIRFGTQGYGPAMLRPDSHVDRDGRPEGDGAELVPTRHAMAAENQELWNGKRNAAPVFVKGLQRVRCLSNVVGLGVVLALVLVIARQQSGTGDHAWRQLFTGSIVVPVAILVLSHLYRRTDDHGWERKRNTVGILRHSIFHFILFGALWLSILVFLREFFLAPGFVEAWSNLVSTTRTILGSGLGNALLVAGGTGLVASVAAYFLARDLLSWEQFRTGANALWQACLVLLAVGILGSWMTSSHAPLADLNAWFAATDARVWIVALALYMGLAWQRLLRRAALAGAGLYALFAHDQQACRALLRAGKEAFQWVFSPPNGGGAVDLTIGLLESTGKVLGSWQGLLCLGIVVLAYAASGWARTKIQDRGAAMWRGGTTSGESA